MIREKTKALLLLLMAMISITTAYADERDMGTWSENTGFGQNAEDWTADGYSKWDGQSFQNYELRTSGEQQGIHIANAAQLARYAYDMYNYNNSYWSDRRTRDVYLECDIDLNNKYFSITRSDYYIENATFHGQGHVIRNGYGIATGGRCALFSDIRRGGGDTRPGSRQLQPAQSQRQLLRHSLRLCRGNIERRHRSFSHHPQLPRDQLLHWHRK